MEVTVQAGAEARFYDIHHNAVVYIDKLEGNDTPQMHEDNKEGLTSEQATGIAEAIKELAGKPERAARSTGKPAKGRTARPPFRPTDQTYTYVYQKENPRAIPSLYNALMRMKWLEERTPLETFEKLFSGTGGAFHIRWNRETTQLLWYMFKLMKERNYITRPDGITMWAIEKSHFLSKEGRQIDDWNSQHVPVNKTEVETLVGLLDPTEAIMDRYDRQESRLNGNIRRRLSRERNDWDD